MYGTCILINETAKKRLSKQMGPKLQLQNTSLFILKKHSSPPLHLLSHRDSAWGVGYMLHNTLSPPLDSSWVECYNHGGVSICAIFMHKYTHKEGYYHYSNLKISTCEWAETRNLKFVHKNKQKNFWLGKLRRESHLAFPWDLADSCPNLPLTNFIILNRMGGVWATDVLL